MRTERNESLHELLLILCRKGFRNTMLECVMVKRSNETVAQLLNEVETARAWTFPGFKFSFEERGNRLFIVGQPTSQGRPFGDPVPVWRAK